MPRRKNQPRKQKSPTSWDPLAAWYDGWVGKGGSKYHQKVAVPALLDMLSLSPGEKVLDLGAGQGVLTPFILEKGASYTGVDISEKLLEFARMHHGSQENYILGDARYLASLPQLKPEEFDAVVFLLSIQDMNPLSEVLESAEWSLKPGGRIVILMTHPCFRVPRQSGWGWDEKRKLRYRRVDRYITQLSVPMKAYPNQLGGKSRSYHRPISEYVNTLAEFGLLVDCFKEISTFDVQKSGSRAKAVNIANQEIPLFLGIRARKLTAGIIK